MTWSRLNIGGSLLPPPRWGHTAVAIGSTMYIIGGTSDEKFYNDVWSISQGNEDLPIKPPRGSKQRNTKKHKETQRNTKKQRTRNKNKNSAT